MTRERILCFLPDLDGGGAQRTMVNLVNAFPAVGIEPILVTARGNGEALQWIADSSVVHDLGANRTLRAAGSLLGAISRFRPDMLFSTMVDANILASAVVRAMRQTLPVVLRETNSHRARGDLGFMRKRLVGWTYRRADAVVALSCGVRRELIEDLHLNPERVVTLPNPVEVSSMVQAAAAARNQSRPVAGDGPLLVAIGRLTRQKGFDILIEAFAGLRNQSARLAILGIGPDKECLRNQARRLNVADRISFPGFVARPVEWLAHADLFILPSRWEGFGHVIVEAMAAGVPVVATDCPHGPRDIVISGKNGVLIGLGDDLSNRMRDQIDKLLAEPSSRRVLKAAALQSAYAYEAATVAARYADLFQQLIAGRQPGAGANLWQR